ncbi:hypothetical protein [Streptomyces sp. NPDC050534]|uniref:hypothetical protein n=1 Tax=Streptomyces sp. NPDC050534 TaxID=3365625 RepID=UPI0037A858F2
MMIRATAAMMAAISIPAIMHVTTTPEMIAVIATACHDGAAGREDLSPSAEGTGYGRVAPLTITYGPEPTGAVAGPEEATAYGRMTPSTMMNGPSMEET